MLKRNNLVCKLPVKYVLRGRGKICFIRQESYCIMISDGIAGFPALWGEVGYGAGQSAEYNSPVLCSIIQHYSQKCHRLDASSGFYQLDASL